MIKKCNNQEIRISFGLKIKNKLKLKKYKKLILNCNGQTPRDFFLCATRAAVFSWKSCAIESEKISRVKMKFY